MNTLNNLRTATNNMTRLTVRLAPNSIRIPTKKTSIYIINIQCTVPVSSTHALMMNEHVLSLLIEKMQQGIVNPMENLNVIGEYVTQPDKKRYFVVKKIQNNATPINTQLTITA